MAVFIDTILNGNIESLLGSDLYQETISKIVIWWSILPMIGIILMFCFIIVALFRGRER